MHKKFLPFLADPLTHEPLELKNEVMEADFILSGLLYSSKNQFPIINGVARFVSTSEDNYAKSFGWQWNKWKRVQFDSENIGRPMEGYTNDMWEKICCLTKQDDLSGKVVLDMGCGPGRFMEIVVQKKGMVIGLDYSNAVDAAQEIFKGNENICIIQGDALQLPLKDNCIDASYSIGVLHHTPNPPGGVKEVYRALKPGGWFAISVYGKGGYYDKAMVQLWRKFFNLTWKVFKHYPPLIYSNVVVAILHPVHKLLPGLTKIIKQFLPYVQLPDKRWSVLDTFDSLTPSHQSAHESYEVYSWFKEYKFNIIQPANWSFTSYKGWK